MTTRTVWLWEYVPGGPAHVMLNEQSLEAATLRRNRQLASGNQCGEIIAVEAPTIAHVPKAPRSRLADPATWSPRHGGVVPLRTVMGETGAAP